MDGMKLDEEYRQKNGLAPTDAQPKRAPKEPVQERVTFDASDVGNVKKPSQKPTITKTKIEYEEEVVTETSQPDRIEELGFIDKVLAENDAPKKESHKKTKPPKSSSKPKSQKSSKVAKSPKQTTKQKTAPKKAVKTQKLQSKKPLHGSLTQQLLMIGKIVIVAAIIIFALYNYIEVKRLNNMLSTETGGQSQVEENNKKIIDTIGSFRILPDSEYEIYTVKDKSKLVSDPVFDDAENGDKVIVYPKDSLTIVYRESENKIVSESKNSSLTEKK